MLNEGEAAEALSCTDGDPVREIPLKSSSPTVGLPLLPLNEELVVYPTVADGSDELSE